MRGSSRYCRGELALRDEIQALRWVGENRGIICPRAPDTSIAFQVDLLRTCRGELSTFTFAHIFNNTTGL